MCYYDLSIIYAYIHICIVYLSIFLCTSSLPECLRNCRQASPWICVPLGTLPSNSGRMHTTVCEWQLGHLFKKQEYIFLTWSIGKWRKMYLFRMYNLIYFDICTHTWNLPQNQNSEGLRAPHTFLSVHSNSSPPLWSLAPDYWITFCCYIAVYVFLNFT